MFTAIAIISFGIGVALLIKAANSPSPMIDMYVEMITSAIEQAKKEHDARNHD